MQGTGTPLTPIESPGHIVTVDHWQEDAPQDSESVAPHDVVDVSYRMRCRELPVDHVHALASALQDALPWLRTATNAGVHPLYGAESGNGWQRPQDPDAALHLSRRTRLKLRLPTHRLPAARALVGCTIQVAGRDLGIGELTVRPLTTCATLFSRYVASHHAHDEVRFLAEVCTQLENLEVSTKRLLAGRLHSLRSPDGPISARSLMVADLSPAESLRLQEHGIGMGRSFCCGLFVPHRSIEPVGETRP